MQRTHFYAIVDEADSILIDEARTPLIIGANNQPTQEEAAAYYGADQLAATLVRVKDYKYDPLERKAELTAAGRRKVQAGAAHPAFVTLTVDGLYEYVERRSGPRSPTSATATTSCTTARSSSSTSSPAA